MTWHGEDTGVLRCGNCDQVVSLSCRCIPARLREHATFRQAVGDRDLAVMVRFLRAHTRLTQTVLGKVMDLPQATISRIESGKHVLEDRRKIHRAFAGLGVMDTTPTIGAVEVSLPDAGGPSPLEDVEWSDEGAMAALGYVLGAEPSRRTVLALAGSAVAAQVMGWALADPSALVRAREGGPLSEELYGRLARAVDIVRMADAAQGASPTLRAAAVPQLENLHRLLKVGNSADPDPRLLRITADLTGLVGWMAVDAGQDQATTLLATALRAAHAAGDPVLGAGIISYMAVHAYSHGEGRLAALMASNALHRVRGLASPRVECLLWIRQARGHAAAGEEHQARLALDHARQAFDQGPREDDPDWLYWIDAGELACQSGTVLLESGHPDQALEHLENALEGYQPELVRDMASSQIRAAKALTRMGEVDAAGERAHRALDLVQGLASQRTNTQVRELLHGDLAPHAGHPVVEELAERARPVIGALI